MRQGATQHNRGGTKSEEKNTNQNASKRLLTASFVKAGDACMPASSQACKRMRQRATQHKRGETNSEEKTPFKTQSSGCLLQALTKPSRRTLACSCLLLAAGRREKCRVVDRRPQHQKRPLSATTRKPASACVREQRNTSEGKTKARKKTPIKTLSSGCLPQALQKAEHTCMPACSQACKRMRQGATQHKRGEINSEEKTPFKTHPSGCLPLLHRKL